MEKTIEERAMNYVKDWSPMDWEFARQARSGYIKGATEQKAIDIDKACEWLTLMLQCGCHQCSGRQFVIDFRKMMEE